MTNTFFKTITELMEEKYHLEDVNAVEYRKILKLKGLHLIRCRKIAHTERLIKRAYEEYKAGIKK